MTEDIKRALEFVAKDLGLAKIREKKAVLDPSQTRALNANEPRARAYVAAALRGICAELAALDEGSRNQTMNDGGLRMGHFVGGGYIEASEVQDAINDAAEACGLGWAEINATLPRAIADGVAEPVELELPKTDEDEFREELEAKWAGRASNSSMPPDTGAPVGDVDSGWWERREELRIIRQFARARIVSPWAVLGTVLARIVCAVEPNLVLPPITGGEMSLNIFVALTGASGTGKDAAQAVAEEAVEFPDYLEVKTVQPGSGEGIAHAFVERKGGEVRHHETRVLFVVSEIDTFAALSARKGATLTAVLRDCFGGAPLGFQYADASKRVPVAKHAYRMGLIAGVQPGRAGALLDDADGGTPQRFLWVSTNDPGAPDVPPEAPAPFKWKRHGSLHSYDPTAAIATRMRMQVCTTAKVAIIENRQKTVRGNSADKLDGHLLLTRLKAAAALALLNGRVDVGEDDWEMSQVVINHSLATRGLVVEYRKSEARVINDKVGEKQAYRDVAAEDAKHLATVGRVSKLIVKKMPDDGGWISFSDIRRQVTSRDRKYAESALEDLVVDGTVNRSDDGAATRYRLSP